MWVDQNIIKTVFENLEAEIWKDSGETCLSFGVICIILKSTFPCLQVDNKQETQVFQIVLTDSVAAWGSHLWGLSLAGGWQPII